jgi:hypothetical protein
MLTLHADLTRQLQEKDETIRRLRGALALAMHQFGGYTVLKVDGVATIYLGSGAVYQHVQERIDTPATATERAGVEYRWTFKHVANVPTSPAALVAEAMGEGASIPDEGMSVEGDEMARAS